MLFTIVRLQSDVMVRLGEIAQPQPTLSATTIPGPADIVATKIKIMLPEIGSKLIRETSPDLLGNGEIAEPEFSMRKMPCGMYAAEIALPEGFLRMVSLKMESWSRSVGRLILSGSADGECQWSTESGIAGSPDRPRVYLDGDIVRAVGSKTESDKIERFVCWQIPSVAEDGTFCFPAALYPILTSIIAAKLQP